MLLKQRAPSDPLGFLAAAGTISITGGKKMVAGFPGLVIGGHHN